MPKPSNNGDFCETPGLTLNLFANDIPGATFIWTGPNGFTSNLQNPVINNLTLAMAGDYYVSAVQNGCTTGPAVTTVKINTNPPPPVISSNGPYLCEGQSLNLSASTVANGTYYWTGPNGFISNQQNPVINNFTTINSGTYNVIVIVNGCGSPAAITTVILQPPPVVFAGNNGPLCAGQTLKLSAVALPGSVYSWTGPNGYSSSLQYPVINNVSFADTGDYYVSVSLNGCNGFTDTTSVVVKPIPSIPVISTNSPVCTGNTLQLGTPFISGVTYNWTGPNGFTSILQNPSVNNPGVLNSGLYTLTVTGCTSASNSTVVTVNPSPPAPSASNNGALCVGQTLQLTSGTIAGAAYTWTGPNGFTSTLQNPVINNAGVINAGNYDVKATMNGCTGAAGSTAVVISDSARANAGSNQAVCFNNSQVMLSGTITGGSNTGVWTTNGSGTFSPSSSSLTPAYTFTTADKQTGKVDFTLTSTNNGVCPVSVSNMSVSISNAVSVNAGSDQLICRKDSGINLGGQVVSAPGGIWTTSGDGMFLPDNKTLQAKYIPGNSDRNQTSVTLSLTSTGNCTPVTDELILTIDPGPTVNAGPDIVIKENESVQLQPVVTGNSLQYLWTPGLYLSNDTIKNPVVKGINDQLYSLTVTSSNGCSNSDQVMMTVLKYPDLPNTFTPNNDGINDVWVIKNLPKYTNAKIQVFNRYGQIVFESIGYNKPWDGTVKGSALPMGTYYYVVEPGSGLKPITGYVTIIK
jgi:gliding motility-associated-like protein